MSSDYSPDRDDADAAFDSDGEATPCAYTRYVEGDGSVEDLPATGDGATGLEREVWDALYAVDDPEMPVSIVDLGLVYGVELERAALDDADDSDGAEPVETRARVVMTLTYTGCPARTMLQDDVREAVGAVEGIDAVVIELVWSPEWSLEMVTDRGKDDLREFGLSV